MNAGITEILELVMILLFTAALVGIVLKRFRLPYTVGLVLMGLTLTVVAPLFLELSSNLSQEGFQSLVNTELIMSLLVPPLIFEAAFNIKFSELKRNLRIILTFAIPGVIITMLLVGGIVSAGTSLSLPAALVFGALIAATDPVAVVSLFKTLGVPKRIQVLLEGESLLNDGTAIVIFGLMLTFVETAQFSFVDGITEFLVKALGGIVVGFVISSIAAFVIRSVDDFLIEITLTVVAAYGAYLVAEEFHFAGVLAVVTAGLVLGNIGPRGMSPTTRISLHTFWEYLTFLVNSLIFLLIGLVIDLNEMFLHLPEIILAIVAVLVARIIVIYGFSRFVPSLAKRTQHVLFWGGIRGAISLALMLSLPIENFQNGEIAVLQAMSFGVVLFTIVIQGSTMSSLISRLKLNERTETEKEFERSQARAVAAQASFNHLETLNNEGMITDHAWELIKSPLKRQIEVRTNAVREIMSSDRSVEIAELNNAFREALIATRSKYNALQADGALDEENFHILVSEVDTALSSNRISYADSLVARGKDRPPLSRLITTTLTEADARNVSTTLNVMGVPVTQYESFNAEVGEKVITLIVGIEHDQEEEVVGAIMKCCSEEPSFRPNLIRNLLPMQPSREVETNGIQVFIFDIEHFEEF